MKKINHTTLLIIGLLFSWGQMTYANQFCSQFFSSQSREVEIPKHQLEFLYTSYFARTIELPLLQYATYPDLKFKFLNRIMDSLQDKASVETAETPYFAKHPEFKPLRAEYKQLISSKQNKLNNPVDEGITKEILYGLSRHHLKLIRPEDNDRLESDFQELLTSFWNYFKENLGIHGTVEIHDKDLYYKDWAIHKIRDYYSVFESKLTTILPYVVEQYKLDGFREAQEFNYNPSHNIEGATGRKVDLLTATLKAAYVYKRLKRKYDDRYGNFKKSDFNNLLNLLNDPILADNPKSMNQVAQTAIQQALEFQVYKVAFAALDVYLAETNLKLAYVENNIDKLSRKQESSTKEDLKQHSVEYQAHKAQFIADLMFLTELTNKKTEVVQSSPN